MLKGFTHGLDTKGNIKNTALETGKELLVGVVGGGLLGAAIGKPSFLIGLGVTGAGHYMDSRIASLLGIGMMASNGFQQSKAVDGLDGMTLQSIKERLNAYKDNFSEKLYLDTLLHKKKASAKEKEVSGFGQLQFFNYPNDSNSRGNEYAALESIERQVQESGMSHMQMRGLGDREDREDREDTDGIGDPGDLSLVDASDYNL
jgi:hypothetical protein